MLLRFPLHPVVGLRHLLGDSDAAHPLEIVRVGSVFFEEESLKTPLVGMFSEKRWVLVVVLAVLKQTGILHRFDHRGGACLAEAL